MPIQPVTKCDDVVPESQCVGARLQMIRKQFGLSQRELARRADMTNSTLSMIEQGKVSPSVASLEKILGAIPLTLKAFFSESLDFSSPVFSLNDFRCAEGEVVQHVVPLSSDGQRIASLSKQVYAPGTILCSDDMLQKGFVCGILIKGILYLHVGQQEYSVEVGEGFHFSLNCPYQLCNQSDQESIILIVSFRSGAGL